MPSPVTRRLEAYPNWSDSLSLPRRTLEHREPRALAGISRRTSRMTRATNTLCSKGSKSSK